jgi:hypothetical protein
MGEVSLALGGRSMRAALTKAGLMFIAGHVVFVMLAVFLAG